MEPLPLVHFYWLDIYRTPPWEESSKHWQIFNLHTLELYSQVKLRIDLQSEMINQVESIYLSNEKSRSGAL